jgi:stage II sporulation protein E
MKTEILSNYRSGGAQENYQKTKGKKNLKTIFSKKNMVLLIVAFLLGRCEIAGTIMPFGPAIYAATFGIDVSRVLVAVLVILGMMTVGAGKQIYTAIASMMIFNAFNMLLKNSKTNQKFRLAVIAFFSVLLPGMIMAYFQGFLLYDLLKALFSAFIAFLLIFVFRNVVPLLSNIQKRSVFSSEEAISLAIMFALALSGLGEIKMLGFGVKNILSILTILIFGYKFGSGVGAAAGVTIGLMVSMSSTAVPLIIGSYAFCGLLSGIFKNLGKLGTGLGFVMGNAVITLYLSGSTQALVYLKEIVVAIIIFMIIPQKLIDGLSNAFSPNVSISPDKKSYGLRIKEITVEKLNKFSAAFKELSKTFSEISQTKMTTDKQDISSMFDRVADKVCKDCSLCLYCWDRNFYNTYQVMFKIVERLEARGRIEENDIPGYFLERCERIYDFVQAVNNIYELFKVDMVWKSKVGESRNLVSQQLEGLAKVISNLAFELNADVHFNGDLEDSILIELSKTGIKVDEAIVLENKFGKYEVSILHKGCGSKKTCATAIEKAVSLVLGRMMVRENTNCYMKRKTGQCALKLVEEEPFRVTTGVARAAKYDNMISGDSYTFMNSGSGKFIIALSDGMGSGKNAALQSRAAINLLEQFMESGFDKDTTIKLINSILLLKSNEEAFSTIDLTLVDLYDGKVEFVKIGAVPTYIKRTGKVEVVRSASLPAGILDNIELELASKKVESGDIIIMMTDGILDSFVNDEDSDKSIFEFIEKINNINPQRIADMILDKAYENCGGKPLDDMMVLVAKVWMKAGL